MNKTETEIRQESRVTKESLQTVRDSGRTGMLLIEPNLDKLDPNKSQLNENPQHIFNKVDGAKGDEWYAFEAGRRTFDLPLEMAGTPFQQRVWQQLLTIQYGVTVSYMDIAIELDNPQGVRAVGAANGQNPISIIVPCHRVIGRGGKLTGYGGGLWRKEWLLKHEGALLL